MKSRSPPLKQDLSNSENLERGSKKSSTVKLRPVFIFGDGQSTPWNSVRGLLEFQLGKLNPAEASSIERRFDLLGHWYSNRF